MSVCVFLLTVSLFKRVVCFETHDYSLEKSLQEKFKPQSCCKRSSLMKPSPVLLVPKEGKECHKPFNPSFSPSCVSLSFLLLMLQPLRLSSPGAAQPSLQFTVELFQAPFQTFLWVDCTGTRRKRSSGCMLCVSPRFRGQK